MERTLIEKDGYEVSLLWLPEEKDKAVLCITGPGMATLHIPMDRWRSFTSAVSGAWAYMLLLGDGMFEEE